MVLTICQHALVRANQLRREVQNARGITNAQHREHQLRRLRQQANFFVRRWANQAIGYIPQLHPNDVDRLVGCLARVEHAVGSTLPGLGPLRRAAGRRLSLP
jgi:hypothetical protein